MSNSKKQPTTGRYGGSGASRENRTEPVPPERHPPESDGGRRRGRVSVEGREVGRDQAHDPKD
jgi:hypothetical protein